MLTAILMFLLIVLSLFLGLFILIQQGKGDMGLGGLGGGSQTLFGGSGGQDFFQKSTWVMGLIFMAICLVLTVWKDSESHLKGYQKPQPVSVAKEITAPVTTETAPQAPTETSQAS